MNNWKKNVRKVVPYTPGEQPQCRNIIKLNTNENPYPPSPKVFEVIKKFDSDMLKKYSDPSAGMLVDSLAEFHGVGRDMVFVGVGSDDVLGMAFMTFFCSEKPIFFPDITYSFYDVWAELFKIPYEVKALDEDFKIRKEDYLFDNGGIVIANPNAPTSIEMKASDIEEIVAANPDSVVVIDEAYTDFGSETVLPLVERYDNLLVVRTFSKSRSMAGMRIGYAVGQPEIIKAMNDVKNSYNSYTMSHLAILSGAASVKDKQYFQETLERVIRTREKYAGKLKELGFSMPDSSTNFLFATHESVPAEEIFNRLRDKNIYIRYFKKPRIDNYIRISVGTDEEMERLVEALKEILS